MKVSMVGTTKRRSGGTYFTRVLCDALGAELVSSEQSVPRLLRRLARDRPEVYHIQFEYRTFGGVVRSLAVLPFLAWRLHARRPVLVTLHGIVTPSSLLGRPFRRAALLAFRASYRWTARHVDTMIVHSELMRSCLRSEYRINNATVIPLGTKSWPSRREPLPGGPHLLFFGFVRPDKGIQDLLLALRILKDEFPDIRLTIAGWAAHREEEPYLDFLRRTVREMGLEGHVEFISKFVDDAEIRSLVSRTTVVVLPYKDRFVEVSAVVHDLAGAGVPLVCSDTPRFSELTDRVDCLKAATEGPALAQAIRTLVNDPALASRLSENLRQRSQTESWKHVVQAHLDVYRKAVARSRFLV